MFFSLRENKLVHRDNPNFFLLHLIYISAHFESSVFEVKVGSDVERLLCFHSFVSLFQSDLHWFTEEAALVIDWRNSLDPLTHTHTDLQFLTIF